MKLTRRRFLKTAAAASVSFNAAPLIGANPGGKYRTALIGSGWWGKNILKEAMKSGRVKVVALCDVDANTAEVAAEQVNDLSGDRPKIYKDYRELLEKELVHRFVPRVIQRIAVQASGEVVERWSGRLIPVASSLIGAGLNYYFVRAWGERARIHFRNRHLEIRNKINSGHAITASTTSLTLPV